MNYQQTRSAGSPSVLRTLTIRPSRCILSLSRSSGAPMPICVPLDATPTRQMNKTYHARQHIVEQMNHTRELLTQPPSMSPSSIPKMPCLALMVDLETTTIAEVGARNRATTKMTSPSPLGVMPVASVSTAMAAAQQQLPEKKHQFQIEKQVNLSTSPPPLRVGDQLALSTILSLDI